MEGSELFVTHKHRDRVLPADGGDAETLVKHADVAMYRAKDRGRNTYQFFTPRSNATLHTRLSQEKSLRKALDNGEFVVYYQPQHDLVSGSLTAVEALVRWNHPRSGLVLPGQFIPNAELSGLIVALGDSSSRPRAKTSASCVRRSLPTYGWRSTSARDNSINSGSPQKFARTSSAPASTRPRLSWRSRNPWR